MITYKDKKEVVEYGEDYISIKDRKGEIAYWTEDEWKEDSQLIFSICRAIELAGKNKLRKFLNFK